MSPDLLITAGERRLRVLVRAARGISPIFSSDYCGLREFTAATDLRAPATPARMETETERGVFASAEVLPVTAPDPAPSAAWLAEQIEGVLGERPGEAWGFAAEPPLFQAVLGRLRPGIRGSLVETIQRDLSTVSPARLAEHFRART
jgi:hypothetical protein